MTATHTLRRAASSDEQLVLQLFVADKAQEFAPLGLPAQQLETLIEMQFRARQHHYAQTYPAAVNTILCLEDGTPVGRHLVERQLHGYRSIDLAILPEHRNGGLGTWALRQIQQVAALERVTFRLSVFRSNAQAIRLYERLGFLKLSTDDVSYEMEWQSAVPPTNSAISTKPASNLVVATKTKRSGETPVHPSASAAATSQALKNQPLLDRILPFLREIGLSVEIAPVPRSSFLPGIQPIANGLRIDTDALLYPGDLLHEAGHLAVMLPAQRMAEFPSSADAAEEMGALAWSYAAAVHLGMAPEVVFHPNGYRGQANDLIAGFATQNPIGLPFLWWIGLTTQPLNGQPSIYPRMTCWLREEAVLHLEPQLELVGSA
jgi:RimJ/RimL family protein N-acetyltransferase